MPEGGLHSYEGCVLSTTIVLVLLAWITTTAVGYNRLSWIPLIISFAAFVGNLGAYIADPGPGKTLAGGKPALYVVRLLAYIGWHVEEFVAPFYSYFILETILRHDYDDNIRRWLRRDYFMWVFWSLSIAGFCLRFAVTVAYVVWWEQDTGNYPKGYSPPLIQAIMRMNSAEYCFLAVTEIFTAYGLVVVFHSAIKNSEMYCGGERVGLFKRMLLSTELRVGSLAIIGIARATLSLPGSQVPQIGSDIAKFMWNAQHLYTVVLIIDLLVSKMAAPRFVRRSKTGSGESRIVMEGDVPPCPALAPAPATKPSAGNGNGDSTSTFDVSVITRSLIAPDTKEQIEEEKQLALVAEKSASDSI